VATEPSRDQDVSGSPESPHPTPQPNGNGAGAEPPAARQERVLSEMSHELGNFFHKLYYWADYLRNEGPASNATSNGEGTAAEMLERTIRHLEGFLKIALEYFTPVDVSPMHMTGDDLLNSFVSRLTTRVCGPALEVSRPDGAVGPEVRVDPGRISQALEIAVRHVAQQVGDESRVNVAMRTATYGDRPCVELRVLIERPAGSSPFFRTAEAGVEWALMEKLFQLHGGGICEHLVGTQTCGFSIFVPVSR
jgi:hypothetical protein